MADGSPQEFGTRGNRAEMTAREMAASPTGTAEKRDTKKGTAGGWTLKGIPAETICMTRQAAEQRGMRIGSWVAQALLEAARKDLEHPNTEVRTEAVLERLDQMTEALKGDIRAVAAQTQALDEELGVIRRGLLPKIVRNHG